MTEDVHTEHENSEIAVKETAEGRLVSEIADLRVETSTAQLPEKPTYSKSFCKRRNNTFLL